MVYVSLFQINFITYTHTHYIGLIFLSSPIYHKVTYIILTYYEMFEQSHPWKIYEFWTQKKTYNDTS